MKSFKLVKLDRRNKGYGTFKYYVSLPFNISPKLKDRQELFCKYRNWCWEMWGPSCEIEFYDKNEEYSNPNWCWESNQYNIRIYLAEENNASAFTFKWI